MKCKISFIFIMFFLIIYPNSVIAESNIEFSCYNEVMRGNYLECKLKLVNSSYNIKGIRLNYKFDDNFSYVETNINKTWHTTTSNNNGLVILNLDGIKENKDIGEIKFLVSNDVVLNNNYEFKLTKIKLSDGTKDYDILDKTFKVKVLSISDVLEYISVNDDKLELKDGRTEYLIEVPNDVSSVEIKANLKNNKYYYVENYGPKIYENLKVGNNNIQLKIRNNDLELITYNINVKRLDKVDSPNNEENNEKNEENPIVTNPQTGSNFIWIVVSALILSFGSLLIFNKKVKKEN